VICRQTINVSQAWGATIQIHRKEPVAEHIWRYGEALRRTDASIETDCPKTKFFVNH